MTELPRLDSELLVQIIKWAELSRDLGKRIEQNPIFAGWGYWDQGSWAKIKSDEAGGVCGTSYCIAGQAVTQAGYRLDYSNDTNLDVGTDEWLSVVECIPQAPTAQVDERGNVIFEDVGEPVYIADAGREVLGLHYEEGRLLFEGENSLETLKALTNWFHAARGLPLPFEDDEDDRSLSTESGRNRCETFYRTQLGFEFETNFPWKQPATV